MISEKDWIHRRQKKKVGFHWHKEIQGKSEIMGIQRVKVVAKTIGAAAVGEKKGPTGPLVGRPTGPPYKAALLCLFGGVPRC